MSPKSSKYSVGQAVVLSDGKRGRVIGVNPINGLYQVITSNNKSISVKASDIEKSEKSEKGSSELADFGMKFDYDKSANLNDTPFDLDKDK